ncbi:sigma-70 family RNA polymerase sigma factor [Pedobacter sp. N36a]|uniref:RNA polymerase sigma factor n=1 Tax=Pedobacter sp. N36a TaxID=2767996 RepID=UPI00165724D7|nr:sigma-70 family RNA polymerase sigma factor [Pedobacter sp. N36a]MBC8988442.1 sigma-70 family RNA polymerase sigma factor [Pedobacter sp. N36a]
METGLNIAKDLELFALLKQGDEAAFKHIYDRYWLVLFHTAYKRLPDKDKCEDIIQNVFTDLWNRRADLELKNPLAYLHTAVRFQVLKAISRDSRQNYFVDVFETEVISSLKADGDLLEKEAVKIVEQFIRALPAKRRTIFIMHYEQELSTAEIAALLNISQKTVQNQLLSASNGLRMKLTQLFCSAMTLYSLLEK